MIDLATTADLALYMAAMCGEKGDVDEASRHVTRAQTKIKELQERVRRELGVT